MYFSFLCELIIILHFLLFRSTVSFCLCFNKNDVTAFPYVISAIALTVQANKSISPRITDIDMFKVDKP